MFEQVTARFGRATFMVAAGIAIGVLLAPASGGPNEGGHRDHLHPGGELSRPRLVAGQL
jgi:hypothetical protein